MKAVVVTVVAALGILCGWAIASIILTFRDIADMQDVWAEDEDIDL
jgi:hypothetical protein